MSIAPIGQYLFSWPRRHVYEECLVAFGMHMFEDCLKTRRFDVFQNVGANNEVMGRRFLGMLRNERVVLIDKKRQ